MRDTPDVNGLLDLVQRQASASRALTHCTTFRDMAAAVAEHMLLDAGQFITINPLEYSEDGEDISLLTIATANRQESFDTHEALELKRGDLGEALSLLLNQHTAFLVDQVEAYQGFSPVFQDWMENHKIRALAVWPMRHGDRTFGAIALNSTSGSLNLDSAAMQLYQVLADQIGALVQLHHLTSEFTRTHEISERQRRVFDEIDPNMTYEELASVIARHMVIEPGRFVSLIEFFHNEQGMVAGWRNMVTASRHKTYNWGDAVINLDWEHMHSDLRSAITEGKPFIVEDMDKLPSDYAGQEFFDFFQMSQIKGLAIVPVVTVEGRTLLGLGMLSKSPATYTEPEMNALRNVAEQVGALVQTRLLLQEAQSAQTVASQLAQTNRDIAAAENYEALATTLMGIMPPAVTDLAVALFDKPVQAGERPSTLESKVIVSRTGTTHLQVVDQIPIHPDVPNTLNRLVAGEIIIMPKTSSPILPPITVSLLQAQGVVSLTIIGLRIGPRLLGLLMLGSENRLNLGTVEQSNFRTLADQVAISIENRSLLDQTADTLSFVQTQFEATSAIYDAKHPLETLEAVYRFVGGQFRHAHLGLVNDESTPPTIRIMAEIHHGQSSTEEHSVASDSYPAYEALPALETLYVPDVANESFLTDAERSRLQNQDIAGLVIVPMVANQRMVGLVSFMSPVPTTLSPNRLRALRNLADQAAVVFQNRDLLASTEATLDETRLLYEVNRSILAAQDTLDVLRTIRQNLAPEAGVINHMSVIYDSLNHIQDMKIDFTNLTDGEQVIDLSLLQAIGPKKLVALMSMWDKLPTSISFVENIDEVLDTHPLAAFSASNNNHSTIAILIRENNRVREVISVGFPYSQHFDVRQRRLFEAISDQVAIVLQNHHLLRDAQVSASQLGKQVQTLQTINQFSTTINVLADEQSLLDAGTKQVVELLGIDHCGIVLVEPGGNYGLVVSEYPQHGSLGAKVATVDNPLWGELQYKGEFRPLLIPDVSVDTRIEPLSRKAFNDLGIHSMAILPIVVHNELIGGVGLDVYAQDRSVTLQMVEIGQILTAQINLSLQNVRLLKDLQASAAQLSNQVEVLKTLNVLATRINATLTEHELMDDVVRAVPELLGVDHCGVVILDADKTTGHVVSEYPVSGAIGSKLDITDGNPLYEFVQTKDMTPIVVDVEQDDRLSDETRTFLRSIGTRTVVIVPLIVSGNVIGSLGLDIYREEHTFSPETVEVAQTVASQMAIGLQNVRLLNDTRRRAEQLQRIASFSQSVQATFDLESIFDTLLDESAQMLPIDQMSIMIYDSVNQELRTVAQRVDSRNQIQMAGGELVPISGPIAQVWSTREVMLLPDLRKAGEMMNPSVTVRSWMMAPILSRGRVSGLVSAGSNRPLAYSETDAALFTQLINQLAAAIENAEAYQQSQRIAKNESLVNDISTQLQRQLDIHSMLDITASELGKVLGARKARIRLATHVPENDQAE